MMLKKISDKEYFSIDAVSASAMKTFINKSPAHYKQEFILKNERKQTPAMKLGSAIHCIILEPEKFDSQYVVDIDFGDLRNKENKAQQMAFDERNKDKTVLSEKEFKCCLGVVDAVKESPLAMSLLRSELKEVATEFVYNDFGLNFQCKSKFDVVDITNNLIVDVKTTESANPKQFKYDYFKYGYDLQAAFYMMAYEKLTGFTPDFYMIAIEKESPFAISVIRVQKSSLSVAFEKLHQGFKLLDECMTGNRFPDYSDRIYDIDTIY